LAKRAFGFKAAFVRFGRERKQIHRKRKRITPAAGRTARVSVHENTITLAASAQAFLRAGIAVPFL
jgi:hypothetical protein